jgi:hypothetical protein
MAIHKGFPGLDLLAHPRIQGSQRISAGGVSTANTSWPSFASRCSSIFLDKRSPTDVPIRRSLSTNMMASETLPYLLYYRSKKTRVPLGIAAVRQNQLHPMKPSQGTYSYIEHREPAPSQRLPQANWCICASENERKKTKSQIEEIHDSVRPTHGFPRLYCRVALGSVWHRAHFQFAFADKLVEVGPQRSSQGQVPQFIGIDGEALRASGRSPIESAEAQQLGTLSRHKGALQVRASRHQLAHPG